MTTNMSVGQKVKNLREKAGLNQTQIAKFLEVDQSFVSKCENGERQFHVDALERLCNLFGCVMSDLISREDPIETLCFAFRADSIESEDLMAISDINKIALNIRQMRTLLEA